MRSGLVRTRGPRVPVALTLALAAFLAPFAGTNAVGAHGPTPRVIRVMTIGDFKTATSRNEVWSDAVRARFESVNLRGGLLDGRGTHHPVDVTVCNAAFDRKRAAACAERAASMHVTAVIGMSAVDTDVMWPTLERARIPVIGARVTTLADASSPVSFPLGSGIPGVYTAMPQLLARVGATRIGVVVSDFGPATDALLDLVQQGADRASVQVRFVTRVGASDPDLEAAARDAVASHVDGLIGFVSGGTRGSLIAALGRAGVGGSYVTQAVVGTTPLASDPDDAQQALVVGQFPPVTADVPGMRLFVSDMEQASHGAELERTEGALNAWISAWIFERVARQVKRVDSTTMLRALDRLHAFDTGGLTPPLFTSSTDVAPPLDRLFNRTVTYNRAFAGAVTPLDNGFVDPFDTRPTP